MISRPTPPSGRSFFLGVLFFPALELLRKYRRFHPRFTGENFNRNIALVHEIEAIARDKGCTAAQLALAWVLAEGQDIVPIPGTKRRKYLEQNIGALSVQLTDDDLLRINTIIPRGAAAGDRYQAQGMAAVNR